jgi:hypothetical protein
MELWHGGHPSGGGDLEPAHIVLDRPQRDNHVKNEASRIVPHVDAAAEVRAMPARTR